MTGTTLLRILSPRRYLREQERQRVEALRRRDGDSCARCRRPIRFDLVHGHDAGPRVEGLSAPEAEVETIDGLCLTHGRCNTASDLTAEVAERVRRKNEAELFARARQNRRSA